MKQLFPIFEYCCLNCSCNASQSFAIGLNDSYHNLASPTSVTQNLYTFTYISWKIVCFHPVICVQKMCFHIFLWLNCEFRSKMWTIHLLAYMGLRGCQHLWSRLIWGRCWRSRCCRINRGWCWGDLPSIILALIKLSLTLLNLCMCIPVSSPFYLLLCFSATCG